MSAIAVRTLPKEAYPDVLQMRVDAFTAGGRAVWPDEGQPNYAPAERRLAVYDGDRLVGSCAVWAFGQWLGGRRVTMGGVGGLVIRPEARRLGIGGRLVDGALQAQREWGDAISCLYPTAPAFYRRHGYAMAGTRRSRIIRTAALTGLQRPDHPPDLRRFDYDADLDATARLLDHAARHGHGRIDRDERRHRFMMEPDDDVRAWVAERDGAVVGYVQWERQHPRTEDRSSRRLVVSDIAAADRDTWLALWRMVGSDGTQAQFIEYVCAPHDLLLDELSLPEHDGSVREHPWMARLIDVRSAVAQRGWPSGAEVTVPLQIEDPILRDNSGAYHLMVTRGRAELAPARRSGGTARIDIDALSALFTGHTSATTLRFQGRIRGGSTPDIAGLDTAFASPQPYMQDYF